METEQATETAQTETSTETYESPSLGDMLSGEAPTGGSETSEGSAPEAPAATPAPTVAEAAPQPAATPAPEAPATQPAPTAPAAPAIDPEVLRAEVAKATKGLLGAIQTERQKRQQLEQQLGGAIPAEEADQQVEGLKRQLLTQSETLMRLQNPDYDEVVSHFYAEAANNPALAQTVLDSEVPALAAYQTGQNLKLAKKYGAEVLGNPALLAQKIRAESEAEIRAKVTAELQSTLHAKATERAKTPTDISGARASGGDAQPYRSPSLESVLRKATRRG